MPPLRSTSGQTLLELLVVMTIFGVLSMIAIPAITTMHCRTSLRVSAARVKQLLMRTKEEAVSLERTRGIRFQRSGRRWFWSIYDDGDDDGVRNADIASGVDVLIHGPEDLGVPHGSATIGIPPEGVRHPDDGKLLIAETAPIRFGDSSICSFARDGSSTPGSVYLCDAGGGAAIVRSSGDGGRIRVLFYDRRKGKWLER
jgi:prepilin-type N-terminal cleavage/methylation domain-containing protein